MKNQTAIRAIRAEATAITKPFFTFKMSYYAH